MAQKATLLFGKDVIIYKWAFISKEYWNPSVNSTLQPSYQLPAS